MSKQNLLIQSAGLAFLSGSVLAVYIALTMFLQMPHGRWLALHNLLVVASLVLAAFIGYRHRAVEATFKFMLLSVVVFFSIIMFFYIGGYAVTTAFFADKMVWIPFFYHDYNYHGFQSVTEYLNYKNNYRELLELQIISFLIGSVMYFASGSIGYGAKAMTGGKKNSSSPAQPAV